MDNYRTVDKFDRVMGSLVDLPDVTHTKASTVVSTLPFVGAAQTYIVQTFRQRERGDTVFLQYVDDTGSVRLVLTPACVDAIVRQRESLTVKVRRRVGKDSAAARKARGELPGFMAKGKRAKAAEG